MNATVPSVGRAVVIGGTKGIGLAIVEALRKLDVKHITAVGRDEVAGERIRRDLGVGFVACDVSSMHQVAALGERLRAEGALDLLVHSADVLGVERRESTDGIELSFATNYLSRAVLNDALDVSLRASAAPTVVHVAAAGMPGQLRLDDVPPLAPASSFSGHNTGQRANDVYGLELATRLADARGRVYVFNPGIVDTEIRRNMAGPWWAKGLVSVMERLSPKTSPAAFAQAVVRLALVERPPSGLYDAKGRRIPEKGFRADLDLRRQVWERTEALGRERRLPVR
jgi:NAD(P)-dependent dehydrogenase (short-subunit alcohol dehydrogenase family)